MTFYPRRLPWLEPGTRCFLGTIGYCVTGTPTIFDHVVVDAPPVLGLADAPLICRAVEGSVFVAEPGRSPLRGIRAALQRLKLVGSNIIGVIITKIDQNNSQHYGYNYGYGYGYGYGKYGYGYVYRSEKNRDSKS